MSNGSAIDVGQVLDSCSIGVRGLQLDGDAFPVDVVGHPVKVWRMFDGSVLDFRATVDSCSVGAR